MKDRALHVFLQRHAAQTRVSALSAVRLPGCFARVRATDLQGAQRESERLRAEAGQEGCTIFVDVEVLLDSDARVAFRAADRLGQSTTLRYVGTPRGLAGYLADLRALGIADGVTVLPLRPSNNIIDDVLPMLGLDIAQLAA